MTALAERLRDDGIQRSLNYQDLLEEGWSERAMFWIQDVASRFDTFTCEAVRRYAEDYGFTAPEEPRAWGGVFRKAMKDGLIVPLGYEKSGNPKAHLRPTMVWRKA